MNLMLKTGKGGLYEALACDILVKAGKKDLFFYKDVKSTAEIEFLIEGEDGVIPLEIKAGRKKANSLGKLLENTSIKKGYKLSSQNIGTAGKKVTLPLYMLQYL